MSDKKNKQEYKIQWGKLLRRLSPYNILKGIRYLRHYGIREFWVRLTERFQTEEIDYTAWLERHNPDQAELEQQKKYRFKVKPLISIVVPAYKTPEEYLRQLIQSLLDQTYSNWELCIADGSGEDERVAAVVSEYARKEERIKYKRLEGNLGIAENTNQAFRMASGEYTGLLDHDDLLAPNALYEIAKAIEHEPAIDVVYTDEDKVSSDLKEYFQPHFKPDFNLDLLRSNNYICHFFVVKNTIVKQVGGFRKEYDGAQDYDFIFRCIEKADMVFHIPKILYHWRVHKQSTADNPASKLYAFEAGKKAIEAHLKRNHISADVEHTEDLGFYKVHYMVKENSLISIIIPNKDHVDILKQCLHSIETKTTYQNYEIIIVENNSEQEKTFQYYNEIDGQNNIKVIYWKNEFNYSAINNFGVDHSNGEYIVFLNNDIEIITDNWLEEMLANCQRPEVGITGAKLYYPDNTIQHAGIIVGIGGVAGNIFVNMPRKYSGYLHKASIQQNLSAVTAACMMISKEVFLKAGKFEEKLQVAFNDVDLCLRVCRENYLIVYHPMVELYHHESKSRGAEDTKEKVRRFQREIEYMRSNWIDILKNGDPYYNSNLSLSKWDYSLRND